MYYACLDGNWNADGDSLWGEAFYSVFDPGDDADLYAEVFVGRIPVSTLEEADILVDKTSATRPPPKRCPSASSSRLPRSYFTLRAGRLCSTEPRSLTLSTRPASREIPM